MDLDCKNATRNMRRAFKIWRTTLLQRDEINLNKLEAIKKRTILKTKNDSCWKKDIESFNQGNSAKFWKFSKDMMQDQLHLILFEKNPRRNDGELPGKANLLMDQFSSSNATRPTTNIYYETVLNTNLFDSTHDFLDSDINFQELAKALA